jgi:hypothetical protein
MLLALYLSPPPYIICSLSPPISLVKLLIYVFIMHGRRDGEQEENSYKRTDSQDLKEIKTRGYAALGFLASWW